MDLGLDLIMNPLKTKKKKYQIPKTDKISIYDFIFQEISNDDKIEEEYNEENIKKIIYKSIEIYSEYRPNKYIEDRTISPINKDLNVEVENIKKEESEDTTKKISIIDKKTKSIKIN